MRIQTLASRTRYLTHITRVNECFREMNALYVIPRVPFATMGVRIAKCAQIFARTLIPHKISLKLPGVR